MLLFFGCFVRKLFIMLSTVRTPCLKLEGSLNVDLAVWVTQVMAAAKPRRSSILNIIAFITLHIVDNHTKLHGHEGGECPQVCPGPAKFLRRCSERRSTPGEVSICIKSFKITNSFTKAIITTTSFYRQVPTACFRKEFLFHSMPVKTSVTSSCSISILDTVMEPKSQMLGSIVHTAKHGEQLCLHDENLIRTPRTTWGARYIGSSSTKAKEN